MERRRVTWLLKTVNASGMKYTALQQNAHPADPLTSESRVKTERDLVTPQRHLSLSDTCARQWGGGDAWNLYNLSGVDSKTGRE